MELQREMQERENSIENEEQWLRTTARKVRGPPPTSPRCLLLLRLTFTGPNPMTAGAGRYFYNVWHLHFFFCGADWVRSWHGSMSHRGQSTAL